MPKISTTEIMEKTNKLHREFRTKMLGYIVAALGLVAGLAWNDAIKALLEHYFPAGSSSIWVKFWYALIITLIVIIFTVIITKILEPRDIDLNKEEK